MRRQFRQRKGIDDVSFAVLKVLSMWLAPESREATDVGGFSLAQTRFQVQYLNVPLRMAMNRYPILP
jgi:hypothetical protein